jgi:hypothetical protein
MTCHLLSPALFETMEPPGAPRIKTCSVIFQRHFENTEPPKVPNIKVTESLLDDSNGLPVDPATTQLDTISSAEQETLRYNYIWQQPQHLLHPTTTDDVTRDGV